MWKTSQNPQNTFRDSLLFAEVEKKLYVEDISSALERKVQAKALLRFTEDANGVEQEANIVEVYLLFCNNVSI